MRHESRCSIVNRPAYAYLDGGTAAMLVQVLLGALLGVALFWRNLWWRIRNLFGGSSKEESPSESERTPGDD